MALFLSTFVNKVDRKGRVSVPAPFRAALAMQSFPGVVAVPLHTFPSIECFGHDRMERMSQSLDELDVFSSKQTDLAMTVFADAQPLPFDSEGRIVLPRPLAEHAKIDGQALFVGAGPTFQIWEPGNFARHKAEARLRAQRDGLTMRLKRSGGTLDQG